MPLTCSRCRRVNPPDAAFCFHDGAPLQAVGGNRHDPAARPFPSPFVFGSGVACRTFDELAVACVNNWSEAVDLLRDGFLGLFLGNIGRADLALQAREAAAFPDPDRGLDQFLDKLPSRAVPPPRLHVSPRDLVLGPYKPGEDSAFDLYVSNEGRRLLHGSISCEGCDWLTLGDTPGVHSKMFQFLRDGKLTVHVVGERLRAGAKPLEGELNIQTSGGTATIPLRAHVPVEPFPTGTLAGAVTPRQIAERARTNPRGAAELFENGAVEKWYKDNGWAYPVLGPTVSGLAAVQQFFEALGLVKPPKVEISETEVTLSGKPGETLRYSLVVSSAEKRPIYARAITDAAWLRVSGVRYDGRIATIQLTILVPDSPGEKLQGKVTVTSNGNQQFEVLVALTIAGTPRPAPELTFDEELIEVPMPAPPLPPAPATAAMPALGPATMPVPSLSETGRFGEPLRETMKLPVAVTTMPAPRVLNYATAPVPVAEAVPANLPNPATPAEPPVAVLQQAPVAAIPLARYDVPPPPPKRAAPAPVAFLPPPPPAPHVPSQRGSRWAHATPLLLITLGLLGTFIHDLIELKNAPKKTTSGPVFDDDGPSGPLATIEVKFHDEDVGITVGKGGFKPGGTSREGRSGKWPPSMRFGVLIREPGKDYKNVDDDSRKRLTFEPTGLTNNVCLKVDTRNEYLFGERQSRLDNGEMWPEGDWPGRWLEQNAPLGTGRNGRRSVWYLDRERLEITQIVEIVKGPQSGAEDTCVIRYRIANKDTRAHRVGIRFLLDTYVGENDGAPFLVPGRKELVSTKDQFERPRVPDFIQALENPDLANPGTIAQLQLRVSGLEAPTRVTLGAYPNPRLRDYDRGCNQEKTKWDVPVLPIRILQDLKLNRNDKPDSAVVLYWNEEFLGEGKVREVGFSYGLGQVKAGQSKGQLALTVAGSFKPAEEFTATAYVKNPKPGETVTLDLPDGFSLVEGSRVEKVPPPSDSARGISPVSWRIKAAGDEGSYGLKATLSSGPSQTAKIKIVRRNIFGN